MEIIQSKKNKWVKEIHRLYKRKGRKESGQFVLEGWHLVEEALQGGALLTAIFVEEEQAPRLQKWQLTVPQYQVTKEVLKAMSATPQPQGVLAIAQQLKYPKDEGKGRYLLLDRVQDPGNIGTMIRTADAAGYTAVILGEGCADLYNDKVLRSMQGSQYHIAIYEANLKEWIAHFQKQGGQVLGTQLNPQAKDYRALQPSDSFAILMGNEGQGAAPELLEQCDQTVYLPMKGQAESLNVAVAAGILLFRWQ